MKNNLNIWYDHGLGKGGRLVYLAIEIYKCTEGSYGGLTSQANPESIKKFYILLFSEVKIVPLTQYAIIQMGKALAA